MEEFASLFIILTIRQPHAGIPNSSRGGSESRAVWRTPWSERSDSAHRLLTRLGTCVTLTEIKVAQCTFARHWGGACFVPVIFYLERCIWYTNFKGAVVFNVQLCTLNNIHNIDDRCRKVSNKEMSDY